MAPIATETNGHVDRTNDAPSLYKDEDTSALWSAANKSLLGYGGAFHPDMIVGAKGHSIYTSTGHSMLDWTSGQMSCLIGHGNSEIVQTIKDHAEQLDHLFSGMLSPPVVKLAEKLTSLAPPGLDKAMFLSTGGESNELAIRMAKLATGKFEIVGLDASWHGMTGAALGAQYMSGRAGYGPNMAGNMILPAPNAYRSIFRNKDGSHDWKTELDYGFSLIDKASCGSLAAVLIEPILSSGGILTLPDGYLTALKAHCQKRQMLLIIDEAQTGIGRAGDMFAFQHEGVTPDILTLSKTLGNGIPLSAVLTSNEIAQTCKERNFLFYTTHLNDPLPAAVGLKVLEIVVRDNLVEHSRNMGAKLKDGLLKLQNRYECIGDVRGRGLLVGIEIVSDRTTKKGDAQLGFKLGSEMSKLGLWSQLSTLEAFGGVFRIAPPITVTEKEIEAGLAIMEEAFRRVEGTKPLY